MSIPRYVAVRFEDIVPEGRTHPLVLGCREQTDGKGPVPKLVKALGCPEITAQRQLVAEVLGNAIARRMGVQTPEPCIVWLDDRICRTIEASLSSLGYGHSIRPSFAAGCNWLRPAPAPFTVGQRLTPELRTQAEELYAFDMLSQNMDRRPDKVNCAITTGGLLAYDFELCFQHLFLPIIGGVKGAHWEPSRSISARGHLFFQTLQKDPPAAETIELMVNNLTSDWWRDIRDSLPDGWKPDADRIGEVVRAVADHAHEFGVDIWRSFQWAQ